MPAWLDTIVLGVSDIILEVIGVKLAITPVIVVMVVALLFLIFLLLYSIPALITWQRLKLVSRSLERLENVGEDFNVPGAFFQKRGVLQHIWSEYSETLHEQYSYSDGERKLETIRSTVPAEIFFSSQAVVDTPISAEFFKHLPGILTGVGIIGTFVELIQGVFRFSKDIQKSMEVSDAVLNSNILNIGVANLLEAVVGAFVASAIAITGAIIVTFIEKIQLTRCYHNLERLNRAIDSLFDAGAGEEYLSQLVKSAGESATQTKHLKDSLINDLKGILTELTDRQIEAQTQIGRTLASDIAEKIESTIKPTLDTISGDQGQAVQKMTQDLLSSFMQKLEDVMGSQLRDIGAVVQNSADSMRMMQDQFSALIEKFSQAGDEAGKGMAETLQKMMIDAERRQQDLISAMETNMTAMQKNIADGASNINTELAKSVDGLKDAMGGLLDTIEEKNKAAAEKGAQATEEQRKAVQEMLTEMAKSAKAMQENMANGTSNINEGLAKTADQFKGSITDLLKDVAQTSSAAAKQGAESIEEQRKSMNDLMDKLTSSADNANESFGESMDKLAKITTDAMRGMDDSAVKISTAAERFTEAGNSVSGALERGTNLFGDFTAASAELNTAASTIRELVSSYDRARDNLQTMVETLQNVSNDVNERVGMSNQIVSDMSAVSTQFSEAVQEIQNYSENINDVIQTGFTSFSDALTETVDSQNNAFHQALAGSVTTINGTLEELDGIMEDLSSRIETALGNNK